MVQLYYHSDDGGDDDATQSGVSRESTPDFDYVLDEGDEDQSPVPEWVMNVPPPPPDQPFLTLYNNNNLRAAIRHGEFVTKFSVEMTPREAEMMRFVRANTSVPVPKVYSTTANTITMEYIDGDPLSEMWQILPWEDMEVIREQLRGHLTELRSLEGKYIGSFDGGPAQIVRNDLISGGPFKSEAEFNEFMITLVVDDCPPAIREMISTQLRTNHKIVLTHGYFEPRNIIIREGNVVGILDWEFAGWYPEYWEFVSLFRGSHPDYFDDFLSFFPKRYDHEFVIDQLLGRLSLD